MWLSFRKTTIQEMRPYVEREDMTGISVNVKEIPRVGGMIARDAKNHASMWYITPEFVKENYKSIGEFCCPSEKFVAHIEKHLKKDEVVCCKICNRTIQEITGITRTKPDNNS